jgi:glycosyltransferase involved in cell wall biosynthesis
MKLRLTQSENPRPVRLSLVADYVGIGGAEVVLLNICRHLDRSIVAPRLLCLKEPGTMAPEFEAAQIPVTVIGRGGRYDMRTVPRLIRQFREDDTDVVLVTHLHPASLTLGRLAALLSGRPSVITPHGMDTVAYTGHRCLPRHDVATLFLSDALVLVAPAQGEYLRRAEGVGRRPWSRIQEVVIRNGVPVPPAPTELDRARARAKLGLGNEDIVVGIVARLERVKAHHVLFDAMAKLAPGDPRLRLVCVGEGELQAQLTSLADALGLGDRVLFTGLRRDVPELLPAMDIACLTSTYECAPLAVMEAMAAGVPIVTTDVGAVPDMVTDGVEGFIVPRGDHDALAERISLLARDGDLRAALGANGRLRAEREYRIEDTAAEFQRLLVSLAGKRRG